MANDIISTPRPFLNAVENRFGPIRWDLAANKENCVTNDYKFYGPGSYNYENSLSNDCKWFLLSCELLWLNPPFSNIAPFAQKAMEQRELGAKIAMLMPASVCTNYFNDYVRNNAYIFELTPRVFKVEIRDCILALFTPEHYTGREKWEWQNA